MPNVAYGNFTRHARNAMRDRGITAADVRWTMSNAYDGGPGELNTRLWCRYDAATDSTYVVVRGNDTAVVTVWAQWGRRRGV